LTATGSRAGTRRGAELAEGAGGHEQGRVRGQRLVGALAETTSLGRRGPVAVVIRHAEDLAALPREVDPPVAEGRRGVQIVAGLGHETQRPVQRAVGMQDQQVPVARAQIHTPLGIERRRAAQGGPPVEDPAHGPVGGVQRVDAPVRAGLDEPAVRRQRGARIEVIPQANLPARRAVVDGKGPQEAVVGPDEGRVAGQRRARRHAAVPAEAPELLARGQVEGEDVAPRAEHVDVADVKARALDVHGGQRPRLVGHDRPPARGARVPVEGVEVEVVVAGVKRAIRAEADVALEPADEGVLRLGRIGLEGPFPFARRRIERVDVAVTAAEVDPPPIVEHGGRVDDLARVEPPDHLAVPQRVERAVRRADVDRLVTPDDRRAEDALARPEAPQREARVLGGHRAGAGLAGIAAELRPRAVLRDGEGGVCEGRWGRFTPPPTHAAGVRCATHASGARRTAGVTPGAARSAGAAGAARTAGVGRRGGRGLVATGDEGGEDGHRERQENVTRMSRNPHDCPPQQVPFQSTSGL
jgi:hypothetical protein